MTPGDDAPRPEALFREMDPETRESGLVLDRHGQWHHQGTAVTHARLHKALLRWLTRHAESGRFRIQVGPDWWAWVEVEDAPYQAQLLTTEEDGLHFRLSDDREVLFQGPALLVGPDDAWYLPLGEPGLVARLARGAVASLSEHLAEDPHSPLGAALSLPGGQQVVFANR